MSQLQALLYTDRLSASIAYRPYRDKIGDDPFVRWWIARFRERYPELPLNLIAHTDPEREELQALVGDSTAVLRSGAATKLKLFAEIASRFSEHSIAFLYYGFAFAPEDLLYRVHSHHIQCGNTYTPVEGLPKGTVPELYDSDCLIKLADLCLPGIDAESEPSESVKRLLWAVQETGVERPIPIHVQPFDAARSYECSTLDIPERVPIKTDRDLATARRVISAAFPNKSRLDELQEWRRCLIQTRDDYRRELLDTVPSFAETNGSGGDRIRILFVSDPSGFSGAEESLCQLIVHLDKTRFYPFALLGCEGVFAQRLRGAGVEVISPGHDFNENTAENFLYLLTTFMKIRPKLIHFNAAPGTPGLHAAILMKVPIVSHYRVSDLKGYEELLRVADGVIAVSHFAKNVSLTLEVSKAKVRVVHDEADCEWFSPSLFDKSASRRRLGILQSAKVVLMIARFAQNKRHDLLLQAVLRVKPLVPELYVVLKGDLFRDSDAYDRAINFIRTYEMAPWVRILPFVDDIRELHSAADALVLCSDREALGRCVVEAMSMEVPVIVTDSGGTHEIVKHGETGFVVPSNDAAALAVQIMDVLSNPESSRDVAIAGRHYIQTNLDARIAAKCVMTFYEELLAGVQLPTQIPHFVSA
jgi:glycosyltransferase involved in cell wall biosynthesis